MTSVCAVRLHYAVQVGEGLPCLRAEYRAGDQFELTWDSPFLTIRNRVTGHTRLVPLAGIKDLEPFPVPAFTVGPMVEVPLPDGWKSKEPPGPPLRVTNVDRAAGVVTLTSEPEPNDRGAVPPATGRRKKG